MACDCIRAYRNRKRHIPGAAELELIMPDKETLMQKAANLMAAMKQNEECNNALDDILEFCMKDWHEPDKNERKDDE